MTTQIASDQQLQLPVIVKDNSIAGDVAGDEELHALLLPNVNELPISPPSSIEFNFVTYFAPGI